MNWKFWRKKTPAPLVGVPTHKSYEELGSAKAPVQNRIPIVVTLKARSELTAEKWAELRELSQRKGHAPLVFVYGDA